MSVDLALLAFHALRDRFFDANGAPKDFDLRDKRNTQDDPFDVEVAETIARALDPNDVQCVRAPGPLVSPDMVLVRVKSCEGRKLEELRSNSAALISIEVKKLERGENGGVGRASGLDYNSTPPCGTIRVYDKGNRPVDMRGFYLFVCLEPGAAAGTSKLTAMALCDGDILNADFKYYIDITGERTKQIGVGTYGDGANRNRPMVIFSNPLGAKILDHSATLIHRATDLETEALARVGTIERTEVIGGKAISFACYRDRRDAPSGAFSQRDPFPQPKKRSEKTSGRGRFTVPFRLAP